MKLKKTGLACIIGIVVFAVGYQLSLAEPQSSGELKIGVVSIKRVFKDCKQIVKYREQALAERQKIEAELEKLEKEIEAEKAGLKTLVSGSSDHVQQIKELMMKQASYQAQQKFYEQELILKEQRMIEGLYKDILEKTKELAKEKGLDLVLEQSEPDLPAANPNELTQTISTHKLLYRAEHLDITDEVKARLNAVD